METARLRASVVALGGLLCFAVGCAGTGESASKDKLTQNVGNYAPPPPAVAADRPTVGVPPFRMDKGNVKSSHDLPSIAADQLTTLLDNTQRFDVIERAQIEQLLDEQNMEGIVKPEEMAKAGQVGGVQYLLVGRVTNFRVKQDQTKSGLNLGGIGGQIGGGRFGAGQSGFDKKEQRITTDCGVDLRLVDSTSGRIVASEFGEYKRTDSAGAMGITVLGVGTTADAEVTIEEDDAGKILRLACDNALKKMLPKIDRALQNRSRSAPSAAAPAPAPARAPAPRPPSRDAVAPPPPAEEADAEMPDEEPAEEPAAPAPRRPANAAVDTGDDAPPAAAQKFCGECGAKVAATAKFCDKCGAKAQ